MPAVVEGLENVRAKTVGFGENFTVHAAKVEGPHIGEDGFALHFWMDAENKHTGERHDMAEVGRYKVRDGKIVLEEFYYNAG